jgi:hypothetical protein
MVPLTFHVPLTNRLSFFWFHLRSTYVNLRSG